MLRSPGAKLKPMKYAIFALGVIAATIQPAFASWKESPQIVSQALKKQDDSVELSCTRVDGKGRTIVEQITYQNGSSTAYVSGASTTLTTGLQLTPSKATLRHTFRIATRIWEIDRETGALIFSIPVINVRESGACKIIEAPQNRMF